VPGYITKYEAPWRTNALEQARSIPIYVRDGQSLSDALSSLLANLITVADASHQMPCSANGMPHHATCDATSPSLYLQKPQLCEPVDPSSHLPTASCARSGCASDGITTCSGRLRIYRNVDGKSEATDPHLRPCANCLDLPPSYRVFFLSHSAIPSCILCRRLILLGTSSPAIGCGASSASPSHLVRWTSSNKS